MPCVLFVCLLVNSATFIINISTKHLVLALQAPCTGTTSFLYWHYKHLVLMLRSILYWRYKYLVASLQNAFRSSANAVVLAHWYVVGKAGNANNFLNQFLLTINATTGREGLVVRHVPTCCLLGWMVAFCGHVVAFSPGCYVTTSFLLLASS